MTNFLHWRKMTWAIVLWSAAMVTWLIAGGTGAAVVGFLWLVGMAGLGYLGPRHSRCSVADWASGTASSSGPAPGAGGW